MTMIPTKMNSLINYSNRDRVLPAALIKQLAKAVKNSLKVMPFTGK